ncbi:enoyl-CoA hydratase-related protein [Paraburkholderia sp. B3]|uniref:enoyl-CoA hydratase-related protein n=1 Tax=Paraburkholderia sp. B3 TaxID=3134791 RepID=UPI0039829C8D
MTHSSIQRDIQGQVLILTIHRPAVRNALDVETHHALAAEFDRFEADGALRVAIVTGSGTQAFCAGSDIKDDLDPASKPVTGFAGLSRRFSLQKPVIAAVNGLALGGGVEILLACDIAVAVESARFALPEPRVGLAAIEGGIQRLAQHIPYKFAMQMLLTGESIDAATALRFGLVNEVVPREGLMDAALNYARAMLKNSPLAVETTKRVVMDGMKRAGTADPSLWQHPAVDSLWASHDAKEGIAAFAEKRSPVWQR